MNDAVLAPQPAATAPLAPNPLRINRLEVCDFRAFPNQVAFDLSAKNLLVYGENGAGKSSVFQALRHFFTLRPPQIATVKNIFSGRPDTDFKVEVTFNDGTSLCRGRRPDTPPVGRLIPESLKQPWQFLPRLSRATRYQLHSRLQSPQSL